MKEAYRVSVHGEPDTTSLPPDYTSQRLSISVHASSSTADTVMQVARKGQPPPIYGTAKLELMAMEMVMEQGTLEWSSH